MADAAEPDGPVILFDGVCNLCTASVRFVIARDPERRFHFASLQSPVAERFLGPDAGRDDRLGSVVLIEDGQTFLKSTAALRIARRLNRLWPLLAVFLAIPRPVRDAAYDWIGKRRYRLFGKRDNCWVPSPALRERFLD